MIALIRKYIVIITILLLASPTVSYAMKTDSVFARVVFAVAQSLNTEANDIRICTYGFNGVGYFLTKSIDGFNTPDRKKSMSILDNIKIEEITKCDILYISPDKEVDMPYIASEIGEKQVLTISNMQNFINNEGMVEMSIGRRNNLKLDFNKELISKSQIKIDPTFLVVHGAD